MANQQTSERPTRAELEKLLDAFGGALAHAIWADANTPGTLARVARDAVEDAREKVIAAAMAPCPSCGMELQ